MEQDIQAILRNFDTWTEEYKLKLTSLNIEMLASAQQLRIPSQAAILYVSTVMKSRGETLENVVRKTSNDPQINDDIRELNIIGMEIANKTTKKVFEN